MGRKVLLSNKALELFFEYKPDDSRSARKISERVEKIRKKHEPDIIYRIKRRDRFAIPRIDAHPHYMEVIKRINESTRFLDVGSGPGWDLRKVIKDGLIIENAKGIDIDPFLIQIGFELYRDKEIMSKVFEIGDALSTRFESGYFDIVHSGSVIHALGKLNEVMKHLKEMYRILKKNDGIFFGRTLGNHYEKEYPYSGRGLYVSTPEKLSVYLNNSGFTEIDIMVEELPKEAIYQPSFMLHFFGKP
jgi:SAM-dependent methyltransferase